MFRLLLFPHFVSQQKNPSLTSPSLMPIQNQLSKLVPIPNLTAAADSQDPTGVSNEFDAERKLLRSRAASLNRPGTTPGYKTADYTSMHFEQTPAKRIGKEQLVKSREYGDYAKVEEARVVRKAVEQVAFETSSSFTHLPPVTSNFAPSSGQQRK